MSASTCRLRPVASASEASALGSPCVFANLRVLSTAGRNDDLWIVVFDSVNGDRWSVEDLNGSDRGIRRLKV